MKGFDYNNDDEHRIVMLQGTDAIAGTPEDGVISGSKSPVVLVTALSNDAAKIKRSNWSQSEEKHSRISLLCLQSCGMIIHKKNDGVFDIDNMPLTEEPECVINDLNLYSKNSKI